LLSVTEIRQLISRDCASARGRTWPLKWLDLAEDRLRLDRLSRNAVAYDFLPLG
jgi:hypothetical protein